MKKITVLLSGLVAALALSVGVVYAAELAPQEPAYSWYTDNPGADVFTVANGSDLRGLSALVNGTADTDGDGEPDLPAVSFEGKVVRQGDFAISLAAQEFTPIGTPEHPFQGTFEGGRAPDEDGEARNGSGSDDIRMLKVERGSAHVGLFGYCGEHAVLRGVYLSDAALPGLEPSHVALPTPATAASFSASRLSPDALESGAITAAAADVAPETVIHDVGSVCGYTEGSVELCESAATVEVTNNLQATNDVPAVAVNVGGVAGTVEGDLTGCSYAGDLTVTAPSLASDASDAVAANIGGVAGTLGAASDDGRTSRAGTAANCTNGHADDSGRFGIGKTQTAIHVVTTGVGGLDRFGVQKEATSSAVGGIVGYSYGSVRGCTNYGMVNTNSVDATLYKDSSAAKAVHLVSPDDLHPSAYPQAEGMFKIANGGSGVGGIVGSMRGDGLSVGARARESMDTGADEIVVRECFDTGMVVGLARTGGIVGSAGVNANIEACRNGKVDTASGSGVSADNGHVVSTRWNKPMTGGIAGTTSGDIVDCANLAEVENIQTGYYTAGIVGGLYSPAGQTSECRACFNTGQVHVTSHATQSYREAGLVGNNGGYLHDCVMRSGCVLSHDDGDATYPNAAIGDDSWGMWGNVKFASSSELKKSESAAVLNAAHAADVLDKPEAEWQYWYIGGGYPTLSAWGLPSDADRAVLTAKNVKASCVEFAEYAGTREAIPTLIVTFTDAKGEQVKLVQNVDFFAIPQAGAIAMTAEAADTRPYAASIAGIGNYRGLVENACKYGIGQCDLKNCEVSTSAEKYNFGAPVYPDAVYVRNPAGALLDESDYRYEIYDSATYVVKTGNQKRHVVFDSEGFVSWDGGATRQPVGDSDARARLSGDLTGVDFALYNADGEAIFEVSDGEQRVIDPLTGSALSAKGPVEYKRAMEGVTGGGLAGYIVKVSAKGSSSNLKPASWRTGQYVVEPIDLYRDADIEEVSVEVPTADGSATEKRTWHWDNEKSTLYEAGADGEPVKDSDGGREQAHLTFTGSEVKPTVKASYTKETGERIELVESRSDGYVIVYGDPYTTKTELTYYNRDATPIEAGEGAADDEKALAKQLEGHEKAAVTIRSVLGLQYSNYVHMYFAIDPAPIAECSLTVGGRVADGEVHTFAYRGGYAVRPQVGLSRCGNELVAGTDYEVTYKNNVKETTQEAIDAYEESGDASGLASYTVTGLGNVSGSYTGYYIIASGKSLSDEGYSLQAIGEQQYNFGCAVEPAGGVVLLGEDGKKADLKEGVDYTVSFADNTTMGVAQVVVQGINGYTGQLRSSFPIVPFDVSDPANADRVEYQWLDPEGGASAVPYASGMGLRVLGYPVLDWKTGEVGRDEAHVKWIKYNWSAMSADGSSRYGWDYQLYAGDEYMPPGDYRATLDFIGDEIYNDPVNPNRKNPSSTGSVELDVTVVKADLADQTWTVKPSDYTYDGSAQQPDTIQAFIGTHGYVIDSAWTSVDDLGDCTTTFSGNERAGTAVYRVKAARSNPYYTGVYVGTFDIAKLDLADAAVKVNDQRFTGSALTPRVSVTVGGFALEEGRDFEVEYSQNTSRGVATAVVTGVGSCEGRAEATFNIGNKLDISQSDVDDIPDQLHTGSAVEPAVVVAYEGERLAEGVDYSVSYKNNVNLSTSRSRASVELTGLGDFAGSKASVPFDIVSALDISKASCEVAPQRYTGEPVCPALEVTYDKRTLVEGSDYGVEYRMNVKAGASALAVVTGRGDYTGELRVPFEIVVAEGEVEGFGDASDPVGTSAAAALAAYPSGADAAVVADRHDYAAQVAAVPFAKSVGAPVLLAASGSLSPAVRSCVAELGASRVYLVGVAGSFPSAAETRIAAQTNAQVERIEADDAAELTVELANQGDSVGTRSSDSAGQGESTDALPIATVANPSDPENASTAAVLSAAQNGLFLFTNDDGTLPDGGADLLARAETVVIAGDYASVDASVEDAASAEAEIARASGTGGQTVSAQLVEAACANGLTADGAMLVNAPSLTHCLPAMQLCAARGSAWAVVREGRLDAAAALAGASPPAHSACVVGGDAAFPGALRDSVKEVLGW